MKSIMTLMLITLAAWPSTVDGQYVQNEKSISNPEVAKQIANAIVKDNQELRNRISELETRIKELKQENQKLRVLAGLSSRKDGDVPSVTLTDGAYKFANLTINETTIEGEELFVKFTIQPLRDSTMTVYAKAWKLIDDKGNAYESDLVFLGKNRSTYAVTQDIVKGIEIVGKFRVSKFEKASKRITVLKNSTRYYFFEFSGEYMDSVQLRDIPIIKK